jgi:hypothetical protein
MNRLVNLILWKVDSTMTPRIPEEQIKLWTQLMQFVKADLKSGTLTAWGVSTGGMEGFALSELDGKDLYLALLKYGPSIRFTVKPTISIDDVIDSFQTMQQQFQQ